MKTKNIAGRVLLAGLLSAALPSLAHAMPGDAHDDSAYPSDVTDAVEVPGPIAGPKALAMDDAPYPDVATDAQQQAGIAIALTSGPEPYAHDDVTYAPPSPSVAPTPASNATGAVASRSAGQ
jgi:hypothetical protein